jgi:hypothetical protein
MDNSTFRKSVMVPRDCLRNQRFPPTFLSGLSGYGVSSLCLTEIRWASCGCLGRPLRVSGLWRPAPVDVPFPKHHLPGGLSPTINLPPLCILRVLCIPCTNNCYTLKSSLGNVLTISVGTHHNSGATYYVVVGEGAGRCLRQ